MARWRILEGFKPLTLALMLGCGASSAGQGPAPTDPGLDPGDPSADPSDPSLDPGDPGLEVDPQVCATDADCMIGTPRDCCTGFCPEHRQAWSRAAWAAYQDDCAVEECAAPESLACQPELDVQPPPQAVCVRDRCVLR